MTAPSQPAGADRSTFVTIVAWIFAIVAGAATVLGILQSITIHTMFAADPLRAATDQVPGVMSAPPLVRYLFGHLEVYFAVFLSLCALTFIAAVGLLWRRNWARIAFVTVLALGIVWNLGGLLIQHSALGSLALAPANAPAELRAALATMSTLVFAFSVVLAVAFSALFAWIIRRLLSPDIRREFGASSRRH